MTNKNHKELIDACMAAVAFDPRVEPGGYFHDALSGMFRITAMDCLAICQASRQTFLHIEGGAELVEFDIQLNADNNSVTIIVFPDMSLSTSDVELSPDAILTRLKWLIMLFLNERERHGLFGVAASEADEPEATAPEPITFHDARW